MGSIDFTVQGDGVVAARPTRNTGAPAVASMSMNPAPLRMLTVHAHPDDESSKGASTVARYAAEGIASTLVCCTRGRGGVGAQPRHGPPRGDRQPSAVRMQELEAAAAIIGYDKVDLLGTTTRACPSRLRTRVPTTSGTRISTRRSAGSWGSSARPATGDRDLRRRPASLPHPDHLRVHDISGPAFDRAGDPWWYPGTGEPWTPLKLYYTVWSRRRMVALHETFGRLGLESPFGEDWQERFDDTDQDDRITTSVPIADFYEVREKAPDGSCHPRWIPPARSGSDCRPRWPVTCTPGTTTSSPVRWWRSTFPRTTCSWGAWPVSRAPSPVA
ncbi:MAG: PIG-L family deacetylase [Microthrixaceae bacterium]|nr:PIG-L family deacetylase [Microthrixaceae bacterium]